MPMNRQTAALIVVLSIMIGAAILDWPSTFAIAALCSMYIVQKWKGQ